MLESLNRTLFEWMAAGFAPRPVVLMAARMLAEYSLAVVPLMLAALWFLRPRSRDRLVAAAIAGAVAAAASELIAALTHHPRPFMVGLSPQYIAHAAEGSFPSAHVSLMSGVAIVLLLAAGTRAWGACLAALALVTGWARVYVGVHFPLDIAGALAVAAPIAAGFGRDYAWFTSMRRGIERALAPLGCASAATYSAGSANRETDSH